jgi:hypothetical protein
VADFGSASWIISKGSRSDGERTNLQ